MFSHFGWRSRREVCRLRTISSMVEASDQSPAARQSFGNSLLHGKVEACNEESREVSENGKTLKVWVGPFVTRARKAALDFVRVEPPDYAFGVGDLFRAPPSFSSCSCRSFVREVCLPKRCRVTRCGSHQKSGRRRSARSAGSFTEKTLQEGLAAALGDGSAAVRKPALCWRRTSTSRTRTRTRPSCEIGPQVEVPPPPPPGLGSRQGLDVLDPNVVRSALAAGISEKHLQEMAGLLRKHLSAWKGIPRTRPRDKPRICPGRISRRGR